MADYVETLRSPADYEVGWEYLFCASEIEANLTPLDDAYRDYLLGRRDPTGDEVIDPVADCQNRLDACAAIVSRVEDLFAPGVLEAMFGPPGVAGDENAIRSAAAGIGGVYGDLLAWAKDIREADVPDEWLPVYEALSLIVSEPLREIRGFSDELTQSAIAIVGTLRRGEVPSKPLTVALVVTISDEAKAALNTAFGGLKSKNLPPTGIRLPDTTPNPAKKRRWFR